MDPLQLLFRFFLGGSIVVVATVVADLSKNPYVSGILMPFPVMLIAGALALAISGHPPLFISRYFMGTLAGVGISAVFAISASLLIKNMGFPVGLTAALGVWLLVTATAVIVRLSFS